MRGVSRSCQSSGALAMTAGGHGALLAGELVKVRCFSAPSFTCGGERKLYVYKGKVERIALKVKHR